MNSLRPYQVRAHAAVERAWAVGVTRPAIAHATGTGKTTVVSWLIKDWLARNRNRRALFVAHRTELIEQGAARLRHDLRMPVGVVKATRNETLPHVVMGSVQTLRSDNRRRMLRDVGLIVVDECHHAAAASYVGLLEHYGAMGVGGAVALGVTATMSRGDELALGDVWTDVVDEYPIAEAIEDGWLVRPHGMAVRVADLDLRRVRMTAGDYSEGALGEAIEGSLAPKRIAEAYREHAAGLQGVVFAPTVHSAGVIGEALTAEGFAVELVHAGTPADERKRIIAHFRAGRVQILANCGVFTEGTDLPMIGCVVIARPTTHAGLYIQMAGRGLRLWCPVHGKDAGNLLASCCDQEKRSALVLDVVGASRRHSLSARIELFGAEEARDIERSPDDLDDAAEIEPFDHEVTGGGLVEDPEYVDGALVYDIVDLFGKSDSAWMRTYAGVWFLEAGQRYIAVLGRPGAAWTFDVISMDRYASGTGKWVRTGAVNLMEAMTAAEADVTVPERATAARGRAWRSQPASGRQLELARRYGVSMDGSAGQVSERISIALASARIDPYLPEYVVRV